jgi:hypothetical protein
MIGIYGYYLIKIRPDQLKWSLVCSDQLPWLKLFSDIKSQQIAVTKPEPVQAKDITTVSKDENYSKV